MPSMMTMALSTNMPIASTKAANDTRLHGSACRIKEQERTEYGDDQADTYDKAALEPIAIISISTTMMTDSIRLMTKVPKELPTRSG